MKKVICIDASISSSPSKMIEKYLYLPQLTEGGTYTVIGSNKWQNGYLLAEVDNFNNKGYDKKRFIDLQNVELPEEVGELCN